MSKVIILNGPAGIGKDTLADAVYGHNKNVARLSFKTPMFKILKAMIGTDAYIEFMERYNNRHDKEQPWRYIGGKTPREMMIHISENICKPIFGDDYFGNRLAESAADYISSGCDVIVSDGGFQSEIVPLVKAGIDVHVVRLHSEGFTFEGDSRSYVRMPQAFIEHNQNYHEHDIFLTRGDIDDGATQILDIIDAS